MLSISQTNSSHSPTSCCLCMVTIKPVAYNHAPGSYWEIHKNPWPNPPPILALAECEAIEDDSPTVHDVTGVVYSGTQLGTRPIVS